MLRSRGHGFPHLGSKGRGDLHVLVRVVIPEKLNAEQRRLFEQLGKSLPEPQPGEKDRSFVDRMKDLIG